MKRRIAVLAAVFALAVGMLGGCGNNAQPAADSTKAEENSMDTSAQDEIVKDTADEAQQLRMTYRYRHWKMVYTMLNLIQTAACFMLTRQMTDVAP